MTRIEESLVEKGLLNPDDIPRAEALSRQTGRPLTTILVERGMVSERHVLEAMAEQCGLELVRVEDTAIEDRAVKSVSAKFASHYTIMPIRLEGGTLTIAVCNPHDMTAAEDIETSLGLHVERVLAGREDILKALRKHYGVGADTVEKILSGSSDHDDADQSELPQDLEKMAEDASVVKLVNQLLHEAISDRATDIHFEAHSDGVIVRRRIDGVLYDTSVPRNLRLLYPAIISRIKLMSGLNIVERRLPQGGRAKVKIGRKEYDLRISAVPAVHGEDVVIRILPTSMLFDLGQLGFSDKHLVLMRDLIDKPHGIIFVTGPTGSGKSTTLYACLSRLNTRDRKIITIEDPVEYELKGITQTQVNTKIGLTFSLALRSMLRHDPDIMMVGEVRDPETAEVAIQTAMTGHLVLSTLHTNDAASGAVRLIDMGIEPYLITSTVLAFVAQRLVRVICPDCREQFESNGATAFRGRGCPNCNQSGFRGRVAISEILPLAPEIQDLIIGKASARIIREKADMLGMPALIHDGEAKVAAGITTREELMRATSL